MRHCLHLLEVVQGGDAVKKLWGFWFEVTAPAVMCLWCGTNVTLAGFNREVQRFYGA